MNPILASLLPALKPFAKTLFDTVFVPYLKSIEDKLPAGAVQTIVENFTADIEKDVDVALT